MKLLLNTNTNKTFPHTLATANAHFFNINVRVSNLSIKTNNEMYKVN